MWNNKKQQKIQQYFSHKSSAIAVYRQVLALIRTDGAAKMGICAYIRMNLKTSL